MKKTVMTLLATVAGFACAATETDKSTGSNWLACETDADCVMVEGARCGAEAYCVDAAGKKLTKLDATGATGGSAGTTAGAGGASQGGGGGTVQGGYGGASGGAGGATLTDGGEPPGGLVVVDCYSPGQNLDKAYEPSAVGCECPEGAPDLCVQDVALVCTDGRWQAVEDGACAACWTPDTPSDIAAKNPANGCPCETENETACSLVEPTGYHFVCSGGKWTLQQGETTPCACTSDARCPFGSRCVDGECLQGVCEVDGVRYAEGVQDIPDPLTCHTCECGADGMLNCTLTPCPTTPVCPEGTSPISACIICSPDGGCDLSRTGCQTTCASDADCAATYTPICDPEQHVCVTGLCE